MGVGIIHVPALITNELIGIISLAMIIGMLKKKNRIIDLDGKIPDFLGKISYGIYVIHPLVIILLSPVFRSLEINLHAKYILVYFSVFSFTITTAWLSFEYYEKPFLNLKRRFTTIASTNTKYFK